MNPYVLDVCPLIENVLSDATFGSPKHCAMKCAQDPFCTGYNFKSKQQERNCQLTNTLHHNFDHCNADDKGWIFYHPVGSRKVQNVIIFNAIKSCFCLLSDIIGKDGLHSSVQLCFMNSPDTVMFLNFALYKS